MPTDDGVVETMRTWNPGVSLLTSSSLAAPAPLVATGAVGHSSSPAARSSNNIAFKSDNDATAKANETAVGGGRAKTRVGRMTSPLRGLRDRERGVPGTGKAAGVTAPALNPPPPPLTDVHARLRGSILSPSPLSSPATCFLGNAHHSPPIGSGGSGGGAISCPPMGLEPTGVERIGSHYSPAAQALYLDLDRGRLAWRGTDGAGCFGAESVGVDSGGGPGRGSLEGAKAPPWVQQRRAVESSRAARVWSGLDSRIVAAAAAGHHGGDQKAAAGGLPAAATAPPRLANNLPSGNGIDGRNDHPEEEEEPLLLRLPLPSSSSTAGTHSESLLDDGKQKTPVAPGDPRRSGRTPRSSNSGVRLTHAPDDALWSAEREQSSCWGEGDGGSGGVAQTPALGRAGSVSGVGGDGGSRGHGAAAVMKVARAVKEAETEERYQTGRTR